MVKVAAFCAVTIMVVTFIVCSLHGSSEQIAGLLYLVPDARQIHQPEWGAVFFDEVLQRYAVKRQITVLQVESFLRKVVRLFDEIKVSILHFPKSA
jgi:hypothetical protein